MPTQTCQPFERDLRFYLNSQPVVIQSCLRPICSLDGMGSVNTLLNPVQYRIAIGNGSQCGNCTAWATTPLAYI